MNEAIIIIILSGLLNAKLFIFWYGGGGYESNMAGWDKNACILCAKQGAYTGYSISKRKHMIASLLDGKQVASQIISHIKEKVSTLLSLGFRRPGLAVILLGEDAASAIYVANKRKFCAEVGFQSFAFDLPSKTSEPALLELIDSLNTNPDVDGILVQLPLPAHIDTTTVIERIKATKDVDGFHPYNLGRLAQGNPLLRPCTPYGVIQLLSNYKLPLAGKNAVVVGASNIVGRPMALELLNAKATVTICHRDTQSLEHHIRSAHLIVIATGSYDVVKVEWLNSSQIIIDVGIHRRKDGTLHGDMDYKRASEIVAWITPVPGGIGPMTTCTLLQNTLLAYGICNHAMPV